MKILTIFLILIGIIGCNVSKKDIKVACVGNSITEGFGIKWQSKKSYPVMLDSILGEGFTVLNLGRSATTVEKKGDFPYWTCKEFYDVFAFNPDIIVIKLGTNDTKSQNWNADNFSKDYQALIDTFKTIPSHPQIFICLPVPVYRFVWEINDSTLQNGVIPIIRKLAKSNNLHLIDLYSGLQNLPQYFPDGVHPNEKGAKVLAGLVAKSILEKY